LKDDSGRLERDFDVLGGGVGPIKNLLNIAGKDVEFITVSDSGLQQDADRIR
jgi:hypothetical protein